MYQDIMWYIDDNRFTNMISEIEECVRDYEQFYGTSSEEFTRSRQKFHSLVYYHVSKSGYNFDNLDDIDKVLIPNGKIDRKALDKFEKDIIKCHMYQKHLWEFMGTTSSFGIITRLGLSTNEKSLDEYLPIGYKRKNLSGFKSPISGIVGEIENSVPIYIYSGNIFSTLYDKNSSGIIFDTTADYSGFDWKSQGYNPNFSISSVSKEDIIYDADSDCFSSKNANSRFRISRKKMNIFPIQQPVALKLKLIKSKKGLILQDPYYIFFSKVNPTATNDEFKAEILTSIDAAMQYFGVKKIDWVVEFSDVLKKSSALELYSKILGLRAPDLQFISLSEAKAKEVEAQANLRAEIVEKSGVHLSSVLDYIVSKGVKGDEIIESYHRSSIPQSMSFSSRSDLQSAGVEDEYLEFITSLSVPENKEAAFSHTLFSVLEDYYFLRSSISQDKLVKYIYDIIVDGKAVDFQCSIAMTLERILISKSLAFNACREDDDIKKKILASFELVPEHKKVEKLKQAINNAIQRYSIIKSSTGMSESEVVNAAVTIFYDNFAPSSVIRYISGSDPVNQLVHFKLPISDIIKSHSENKKEFVSLKMLNFSKIPDTSKINIFSPKGQGKWLSSSLGATSSLSEAALGEFVAMQMNNLDFSEYNTSFLPSDGGIPIVKNPVAVNGCIVEISLFDVYSPSEEIAEKKQNLNTAKKGYNITKNGIVSLAYKDYKDEKIV